MARNLGTLTLDLVAKVGGFKSGMDQAARIAEDRSKRIHHSMSSLQRSVTGLFAALGGMALVHKIVEATKEHEDALAALDSALESTAGKVGYTTEQLAGFAEELSKATRFDHSGIEQMQAKLLNFTNITGENFKEATGLALDMAQALSMDLPSAAKLVGSALQFPERGIKRLRKAGIDLSDDQERLIKQFANVGDAAGAQKVLIEALAAVYGGRATRATNTLGGSIDQLKNAFHDLFEITDGLPALNAQLKELTEKLSSPEAKASADSFGSAMVTALSAIGSVVGPVIDALSKVIVLAADVGSVLDNKLFDRPLPEDMMLRRWSVAPRSTGFGPPSRNHAPPGGSTGQAPPSEEFLKMRAELEEQIGLYGKTSEAAKLAAKIRLGSIELNTEAEGKELIALAQTYDAIVARTEAEKEAEAAAKQVTAAYESQAVAFERQIQLTEKSTEVEQLHFEELYGSLQGLDAARRAYLETLAKQVDETKALQAAEAEHQRQLDEVKQLYEETRTPVEKYAETLEHLKELWESGAFGGNAELFLRATQKATEDLQKATEKTNAFAEEASRNVQDLLANFLEDPFSRGLDGLVEDFGRMLQKMAAEAIAADIAGKIFGKGGIGSGGGWLGELAGLFGFAGGGYLPPHQVGVVGERGPELAYGGAAGLTVFSHGDSSRLLARLANPFGFASRDFGGRGSPGQPVMIGTGAQPEWFVPDSHGIFVPKAKQGDQIINQHFTIQTPTGSVSRSTQQQIASVAARAIADASRRNN